MAPNVKQENKESVQESRTTNGKSQERPKAFTIKYKRPRGSRACSVCRSRKVRCDAEIHIPCTNCITFGCECVLPEVKKRGNSTGESKPKRKHTETVGLGSKERNGIHENDDRLDGVSGEDGKGGGNEPILNISQVSVPPSLTSNYKNRPSMHKREMMSSKSKTSLTFLGSSSIGDVAQKVGENHVQLTEDLFDVSDNSLDSVELEILKLRGAFLLPSKELASDLINSYFEHVHPLMPVINRTEFIKKFEDPKDSPSLMLLQAVLLCGCRVSQNPLLLDSRGSNGLACLTFYRRAKALYETNYESDAISVIQTLILIGSYWEGPEDVTKNSFYWTRVAVGLAQGFGLHRDITSSARLTQVEKKIWRRVWWCLFEKDRNVAIAFGRPLTIDLSDCDVPMLTLDDFNEDDPDTGTVSPYEVNETQALYFIHLVKLAEITGIIIKHQYTVKSESFKRNNNFSIIKHCDMLMGVWFTNLPSQLVFSLANTSTQNFYTCLLNAQYYNRLYLIHRSNLLRMARSSSTNPNNYKYPSWGISFQAARMISIVSKILLEKDQIKYCPVMFVYILFSALVMLIYHVDSPNNVIASTASDSLFVSRAVLRELGKFWPIAGVLLKLFDKYANDKIKRAKVIENNTKVAEYQERVAESRAINNDANLTPLYDMRKGQDKFQGNNIQSPTVASQTSGISPREGSYGSTINAQSPTIVHDPKPNIEDLVQQFKRPTTQAHDFKDKKEDTSPSSSTSFPDISLVTENMPTQNFFENFQPKQLFPIANSSLPSTRVQSPTPVANIGNGAPVSENAYNTSQGDEQHMNTLSGDMFDTNFVDSSYIGMNLQSGVEDNIFNSEIGSLFNF